MGYEDHTRDDSQKQRRDVRSPGFHGAWVLAPISLFVATYLATFAVLAFADALPRYWTALVSAAVATAFTIAIVERGRWRIGIVVSPLAAIAELASGIAFALLLVASADRLIVLTTELRHAPGAGFPWRELLTVFMPAAVHEELVFRGYLFQRIRSWRRLPAIAISSGTFAILHLGNSGVTPLALVNLFVAGVLLALAWERNHHLWLPIGIHLGWNVATGPIFGYEVSGYVSGESIWRFVGSGPKWLTGGTFGVEASAWMLLVELGAVALLAKAGRSRERRHEV